jgi:AmiR/NasT family two-component response regulator
MTGSVRKPLEGCRVLVVEDEPFLLMSIADLLLRAGAEVVGHAVTVIAAIHMARSVQFDCAVMDVKLHDIDVFPAAQLVSALGKGIVFVTGQPNYAPLKSWPNAQVLAKPTTEETVVKAVSTACARSPL